VERRRMGRETNDSHSEAAAAENRSNVLNEKRPKEITRNDPVRAFICLGARDDTPLCAVRRFLIDRLYNTPHPRAPRIMPTFHRAICV